MRTTERPRHTQVPKAIDHVRALRFWLAANPDASRFDREVAQAELANLLDALGRPGGPENQDVRPDPRVSLPLVEALLGAAPAMAELVGEHAEQFSEVLPTVLLADVARWYVTEADRTAADRVAVAVGRLFGRDDDTVRAVVATGFLAQLPDRDEPGREVVRRLPRPLRRELDVLEHPGPNRRRWRRRADAL